MWQFIHVKRTNPMFISNLLPSLALFSDLSLIWGICPTFLEACVTYLGLGRLWVITTRLHDLCKSGSTPIWFLFLLLSKYHLVCSCWDITEMFFINIQCHLTHEACQVFMLSYQENFPEGHGERERSLFIYGRASNPFPLGPRGS